MKKASKSLIIIGGNAQIIPFVIRDILIGNIYGDIYLFSKTVLKNKIPGVSHQRVSDKNLISSVKKILENKKQVAFLFCNIPSRPVFETLSNHSYLELYSKFNSLFRHYKNVKKIIFLGSVVALYPNIFNRRYNEYRRKELIDFYQFWKDDNNVSVMCILPPLETSGSLIGRIFFCETRVRWSKKIFSLLNSDDIDSHFEYPYKLLSKIIVKALLTINFNKFKEK